MKKRVLILIITVLALACFTLSLASCATTDFKITFVIEGEEENFTIAMTDLESIMEFEPSKKEGLDFDGWYIDKAYKNKVDELKGNSMKLYGRYVTKVCEVSFIGFNGEKILVNGEDTQYITYGGSAVTPSQNEIPEIDGYVFAGWTSSMNEILDDIEIHAIYNKGIYTITFAKDKFNTKEQKVEAEFESTIRTALRHAKNDLLIPDNRYTFEGWYEDQERTKKFDTEKMVGRDVTLYAGITFNPNGDSDIIVDARVYKDSYTTTYKEGLTINLKTNISILSMIEFNWVDENNVNLGNNNELELKNISAGEHKFLCIVKNLDEELQIENTVTYEYFITILNAELSLSASKVSVTYTGKPLDKITFSGLKDGDKLTYILEDGEEVETLKDLVDVGDYKVRVKVDRENYGPVELDLDVEIVAKQLDIKADSIIIKHGENIEINQVGYSVSGLCEDDIFEEEVKGTALYDIKYNSKYKISDSGKAINISGFTSKNYDIHYVSGVLTVTKAVATINIDDENINYRDALPEFNVTYTGIVFAEDYNSINPGSFICSYEIGSDVGDYDVEADTETFISSCYTFVTNKGKLYVSPLTIGKSNIKWTLSDLYVYTGDDLSSEVKASLLTGNGEEDLTVVFNETFKNAGTYTATAKYSGNNYSLEDNTTIIKIEKANLNVIAKDISIKHGEMVSSTSLKYEVGALLGNDKLNEQVEASNVKFDISITTKYRTSDTNKEINVSGLSSDNYQFTYISGKLIVEKAEATIIVSNEQIIHNSALPTFTFTYLGLAFGEDKEEIKVGGVITDYVQGKPVGEYDVMADITSFLSENYTFKTENSVLEVVAEGKEVVWELLDSYSYNGQDQSNDVKAKYKIDGEKYEYAIIEIDGVFKNADSYSVTAKSASDNYVLIGNNKIITINKAKVSVQIEDVKIKHGETVPEKSLSYVIGELQQGDVLSEQINEEKVIFDIATTIKFRTSDTNKEIGATGLISSNYEIIYIPGKLIVEKASAKVVISDVHISYYSEIPVFIYEYEGLAFEEDKDEIIPGQVKTEYEKGSPIGEYDVEVNVSTFISNNYIIEKTAAKIYVDLLKLTSSDVTWIIPNSITYNKQDQSSLISASATISTGVKEDAILEFDKSFVNAGDYTVVVKSNNINYVIENVSKTVTIQKAVYSKQEIDEITPSTYKIIYEPNVKLIDRITLPTGFIWDEADSLVPYPAKTQYNSLYCGDTQNYEEINIAITIEVSKAKVTLASNEYEAVYSNSLDLYSIFAWQYNGIDVVQPILSTDSFVMGGTYKITVSLDSEYYIADDVTAFIKLKSVLYNNAYYTIEDALNASSGSSTVVVKMNTQFTNDSEIIAKYYENSSYRTVKSNVILLVPFSEDANVEVDDNKISFTTSETTPLSPFVTLHMLQGITLTINGTLNVNAQRGGNTSNQTGHTVGKYGMVNMQANSKINLNAGAVISSNGFIIGDGEIEAFSGSKVYDVLAVRDFRGGKVSYSIYQKYFPFNEYAIQNIEVLSKFNTGSQLFARYSIYAASAFNFGDLLIVGASSTLFCLTDGYITKAYDVKTAKTTLDLHGTLTTQNVELSIKATTLASIKMSTKGIEFPISGNYSLTVAAESIMNIDTKFRFEPGSEFIIQEGGTVNINSGGNLYFFDNAIPFSNGIYIGAAWAYGGSRTTTNARNKVVAYTKSDNTIFKVNGTLNLLTGGALGGMVTSDTEGATMNINGTVDGSIKGNLDVTNKDKLLKVDYTLEDILITARAKTSPSSNQSQLSTGTYTYSKTNGYWMLNI